MLKKIRKNTFLNKIGRKFLVSCRTFFDKATLYCILRWQTSGTMNCNFNGRNFKLFNAGDDSLLNRFYYQLPYHEETDLSLFLLLAKKVKTIFDIGANTGTFSIMAALDNSNATIYSFEPFITNFTRMTKNIELNNVQNIKKQFLALGDVNGEIDMTVPDDDKVSDTSSINGEFTRNHNPIRNWRTQKVKIQRVDDFCNENNAHPNLIKCDVETYEMSVFKGMFKTLENDKPTIIFECFLDEERKVFFDKVLQDYKYYVYLILKDGLVYCNDGFQKNDKGLNYLITPVKPISNFIAYSELEKNTHLILN